MITFSTTMCSDGAEDDASGIDSSVVDASVLVRADDEPAESDAAEAGSAEPHSVDVDEEGLTVVTFGDDEPRSSVYYDEDAPEELR
jgi:predicted lipoprotein with Yx(FWY)xxD motif